MLVSIYTKHANTFGIFGFWNLFMQSQDCIIDIAQVKQAKEISNKQDDGN